MCSAVSSAVLGLWGSPGIGSHVINGLAVVMSLYSFDRENIVESETEPKDPQTFRSFGKTVLGSYLSLINRPGVARAVLETPS